MSRTYTVPNPGQPHLVVAVAAAPATIAALAGTTLAPGNEGISVQIDGDRVRYTMDGSAPTTTRGFFLDTGDHVMLTRAEAEVARWISTGTTTMQVGGYSA